MNVRNRNAECKNCTTIGRAVHGIEDHLMMIQKFVKLNLLKSDITKRGVVGGKFKVESNSKRSYVMNATLSQNVVVIKFHEMPPTNNTERVQ